MANREHRLQNLTLEGFPLVKKRIHCIKQLKVKTAFKAHESSHSPNRVLPLCRFSFPVFFSFFFSPFFFSFLTKDFFFPPQLPFNLHQRELHLQIPHLLTSLEEGWWIFSFLVDFQALHPLLWGMGFFLLLPWKLWGDLPSLCLSLGWGSLGKEKGLSKF